MLMFIFTVPFPLVTQIGYGVIPVCFMLALGYFGLDEIGTQLENPFGSDDNDLPIKSIWNNVEKTTRAMIIGRFGGSQDVLDEALQHRYRWLPFTTPGVID